MLHGYEGLEGSSTCFVPSSGLCSGSTIVIGYPVYTICILHDLVSQCIMPFCSRS